MRDRIQFTLYGVYQSKIHCWTGKHVQQSAFYQSKGRVSGWTYDEASIWKLIAFIRHYFAPIEMGK